MINVLFSGGIDSWACLLWAIENFGIPNVRPIYIDFGQCYAPKEIPVVRELCRQKGLKPEVYTTHRALLEENPVTKHVPFRNTIFLIMSAMFDNSEGVVFGMVKGDWSEDKNPRYVRTMEKLIRSQMVGTIHRQGQKFTIYTPFAHLTKAEVLGWIKRRDINRFYSTIGCYDECIEVQACGNCISCFTRWVAFKLNNLPTSRGTSFKKDSTYDFVMLKWFLAQKSPGKKHFIPLLWKKRAFVWDAYRALNQVSHKVYKMNLLRLMLVREGKI